MSGAIPSGIPVGIRVHFFGNQSTQFIHPLDERVLAPIQAVVPILLSWNGPVSNHTRSESCERWPEWIWAELPSTIPY
jgi:hypothetical protein